MRSFSLAICCGAALFTVIGCASGSTEPTVVTTDEDEIAKYEAMIAAEEESAAADLTADQNEGSGGE